MVIEFTRRRHDHETEPARIVVDDGDIVGKMEKDVIVARVCGLAVDVLSERLSSLSCGNGKPTRHAQMHDERIAAPQIPNEILGAAVQPFERAALKSRGETLRQGETQIRPAGLHAQ